ncbi:MAG: radical SAM protein [Candidatus Hydrogenedentes bacterium]|nr:radical SAM protein [Candidatus Hydrogenedentota bacterium]
MSVTTQDSAFSVARLYESATRMYSTIPYKFFKNGYSFPAWHYYIEVTRRCNLRCKMCQYIEWLENVPIKEQMVGELSTEEWLNVIDQIPRFSLITFTGGEVFVRKDFMQILTHASRKARTHFISNTTMLPEDRAQAVVDLAPRKLGGIGFNFAGTSIEGPGDRHDEIRQMKGAWERSMHGIRELRNYRDAAGKTCPLIHVTTVLQKDNMDVLHLMPKLIKDAGADVLNLVTETRMHDLPNLGEVDPASFNDDEVRFPRIPRQELADALNRTAAEAQQHGIELRLPRMPKEDLLDYYETSINLKDYECRNAWNTLIIGRQGDVYPCWIQKAGNTREASLKEIWNNATMRNFRRTCQQKLFAMCPGCCFLDHKSERRSDRDAGSASTVA